MLEAFFKEGEMPTLKNLSSDTKKVFGKLKEEKPQKNVERLEAMSKIGLTRFGPFELKCSIAEETGFKKFNLFELASMLTGHIPKKIKGDGKSHYLLDWLELDYPDPKKDIQRSMVGLKFRVEKQDYTIAPLNYLKSKIPLSVMHSIAECRENKIFHTVFGMAPSELWIEPVDVDPLVMGVILESPADDYQDLVPGGLDNANFYFLAKWPD